MSLTRAELPPDLWQYRYEILCRRWCGLKTWKRVKQREFIRAL